MEGRGIARGARRCAFRDRSEQLCPGSLPRDSPSRGTFVRSPKEGRCRCARAPPPSPVPLSQEGLVTTSVAILATSAALGGLFFFLQEIQQQESFKNRKPTGVSYLHLALTSALNLYFFFFFSVGEKRQRCPKKLLLKAGTPGRCKEAQRRGHRVWARRSQLSIVTR